VKWVIQQSEGFYYGPMVKKVSVATIAERLGHKDVSQLDEILIGKCPLSFEDADRLCDIFGVARSWLLSGVGFPFSTEPMCFTAFEVIESLTSGKLRTEEGDPFETWCFVLSDDTYSKASIYGYSFQHPYRCDLILNNVDISWPSGGDKEQNFSVSDLESMLLEFVLLCAAIDPNLTRPPALVGSGGGVVPVLGRILEPEVYKEITDGKRAPGYLFQHTLAPLQWPTDLWDLSRDGGPYTKGFESARTIYRNLLKNCASAFSEFEPKSVSTNDELLRLVKYEIENRSQ
jgi:hypothetical protein